MGDAVALVAAVAPPAIAALRLILAWDLARRARSNSNEVTIEWKPWRTYLKILPNTGHKRSPTRGTPPETRPPEAGVDKAGGEAQ